jgi:hypothetical protein
MQLSVLDSIVNSDASRIGIVDSMPVELELRIQRQSIWNCGFNASRLKLWIQRQSIWNCGFNPYGSELQIHYIEGAVAAPQLIRQFMIGSDLYRWAGYAGETRRKTKATTRMLLLEGREKLECWVFRWKFALGKDK